MKKMLFLGLVCLMGWVAVGFSFKPQEMTTIPLGFLNQLTVAV